MDVTCPKCGAENYDSARYCRKCGEQIGSSDFHEAPTRELGHERGGVAAAPEPRRYETFPSAPLNQSNFGTSPRYVPPPAHPVPLSNAGGTGLPGRIDTSPMSTGPVAKKTNWFLIIGGIILAFFLGVGVIAAIVASVVHKVVDKTARSIPNPPGPPGPAGVRVLENPKLDQLPDEVKAWYYTGATPREFVSGGIGAISGSVLTMDTDDDAKTVADFYRTKFRGTGSHEVNDDDDEIVFSNSRGTVVTIEPDAGEDGNTQIVVVIGGGPGMGGIPAIPEAPSIPEPPAIPPPPPAPPVTSTPTPKK